MSKKASLLSDAGQLIASELPLRLSRDIDNSLIGSLQVSSTKGLATGSYQLQLPSGQKGTILVHDVRPKRITFVIFGELK